MATKTVTAPRDRPGDQETPSWNSLPDGAFGVLPSTTHPALQQDVFKELVNKLAWVLGSTYRVTYSNPRSPARAYALRIVKAVLRDNGYPAKIGINGSKGAD